MKRFRCSVMVLAVMMLAVCAEAWADVAIDAANFPDANFRQYVKDTFDSDGNDTLDDSEISSTTKIDVNRKSILI